MNKRDFISASAVGVGSLFLPRISEGVEDSSNNDSTATLEGYTTRGIAELIAKFPKGHNSTLCSVGSSLYIYHTQSYPKTINVDWEVWVDRFTIRQHLDSHKRNVVEYMDFDLRKFNMIALYYNPIGSGKIHRKTVYSRIRGVWIKL